MRAHLPAELAGPDADWADLTVRFGAFGPAVSTVIVGTSRLEHLQDLVTRVERGPLPPEVQSALGTAFGRAERAAMDAGHPAWLGQV
jgi:hypothetical protein